MAVVEPLGFGGKQMSVLMTSYDGGRRVVVFASEGVRLNRVLCCIVTHW